MNTGQFHNEMCKRVTASHSAQTESGRQYQRDFVGKEVLGFASSMLRSLHSSVLSSASEKKKLPMQIPSNFWKVLKIYHQVWIARANDSSSGKNCQLTGG